MLSRMVNLIDSEEWALMGSDVAGSIYEELLERNAQDVKTGAGQYFTPRALIAAIVDAMRPEPGMDICDPAAGTGGFLLRAHDYIVEHFPHLTRDERGALRNHLLVGWELVAEDGAALRDEPLPARHWGRATYNHSRRQPPLPPRRVRDGAHQPPVWEQIPVDVRQWR